MELTPKQQIVDILRNRQKFIIFTHKSPDGDALGSLIALSLALTKMGKTVKAVCADLVPPVFKFLPSTEVIKTDFSANRNFVISLDISQTRAEKIMYKVRGQFLDIVITPKSGQFESSQVSFGKGETDYEAIIVLDMPDLDRLGEIHENNPDFFYELPIVNIDHHAGNSHFGKINLVDLTATSTAEILVSVLEAVSGDLKLFDENIATALLAGIITDTNSFQNANTTPKSLTVAAQLVAAGARQQDIIKNIYKTKPLSTLRLWGRVLSNLHEESESHFVWSAVNKKDFSDVGAGETESAGVVDELLKTASGFDFALLLTEKGGDLHGSFRSSSASFDVLEIAKHLGGGGHPMAAAFQMKNTTILNSSGNIIQQIKEFQAKKTGKPISRI